VTHEVEEKIAERQDAPRIVRCGRWHSNIVGRAERWLRDNLGPVEDIAQTILLAVAKEIRARETYGRREEDGGGARKAGVAPQNAGRRIYTSVEHPTEVDAE
jgi:hypothetical protein